MFQEVVIINNESVSKEDKNFFCDNIAMKSIVEGLNYNFKIKTILRKSKIKRSHKINLDEIKVASNIFTFLFDIFKTFKSKNTKYLLVSITPYTFFAFLLLFLFRKKIFLYLRSNGYEEYRSIIGYIGPFIYHIMYLIVASGSNIIVCQKRLTKKKKINLVNPSELDDQWFEKKSNPALNEPKLLYVGRIKVEKGIFSLLKILNETKNNFEMSIIGKPNALKISNNKIKYLGYINNSEDLIKIYDSHNIFILPSFTEAHPQVLDESLARLRPVILFEDISHVAENKSGIFVSKRDSKSLFATINYVMKNYSEIQDKMIKNNLPTKKQFISQVTNILKNN